MISTQAMTDESLMEDACVALARAVVLGTCAEITFRAPHAIDAMLSP